jgi:hypothetical protein
MIFKFKGKNMLLKNKISFCFFLISIFHLSAFGQKNYRREYKNLSSPEKWWVIFHPFVAKKAYRLTEEARRSAGEMMKDSLLDKDPDGGQVDAFRHAYWMALLSQNICWKKARWLGKAHEKGNYLAFKKGKMEEGALPDSVNGAMDLYNNQIGISIGRVGKSLLRDELKKVVRDSILGGRMAVILKNRNHEALDCNENKIELWKYEHQWNIPKCLISSDHKRKVE